MIGGQVPHSLEPTLKIDLPSEIRLKDFVAPYNFCVVSPFVTFLKLFTERMMLTQPGRKLEGGDLNGQPRTFAFVQLTVRLVQRCCPGDFMKSRKEDRT